MKNYSFPFALICILLLSACGDENVVQNPPSPLTEYPEQVRWHENGDIDVGGGDGKMYVQLQPAIIAKDDQVLIYAADYDGTVTAVSMTQDTKRLWRTDISDLDDAMVTGGAGAGSGVVVVGTSKGQVIALSQDEGEELWRTTLSSEILSAPQAADNIVVVLTDDSRVFGLNAQTGEILWRQQNNAPLLQLRGSGPIIIKDQTVYIGFANGFVNAFDLKTGRILWQQAVSYPRGRSEIDRIVDVDGQMVVKEGVLYAVNFQGRAIAFDTRMQRLLWEREFSSYKGLAVDQEAVFITDAQSKVWALSRKTGDTLWRQTDLDYRELTAPAVFDDMIAVGDYQGYVHFINTSNGQLLGRIQADSSAIHTPPVKVGNSLLILSSNGTLTRLTPNQMP